VIRLRNADSGLDSGGVPRFQSLQGRFGFEGTPRQADEGTVLVYYAFDLLYCDGHDLSGCRLIDRKALLKEIIRPGGLIRYSDHVLKDGVGMYTAVQSMGLEGIVGKLIDSKYVGKSWLKVKARNNLQAYIGGYSRPSGNRGYFGALVTGIHEGAELRYIGHVGTGFSFRMPKEIYELLQPLQTAEKPFAGPVAEEKSICWVKPILRCEVKYTEWTWDCRLRHPIFVGMLDLE
jgi:bifunctional non-homologous end joining protein LigD